MSEPFTKKSLGQHWLYDDNALEAMCDVADVSADDVVLEIGPGLGTLTKKLVDKAKRVVAIEFDDELAHDLPARVTADNLEVHHFDILSFDLTTLPKGYKVVANIPYYLTSKLLRTLCESTNPPSKIALLVQKEVAERVASSAGDMSLLSVSVQFYCDVSLGQVVPAKLFTPPPKVDSQILILNYRGPKFTDVEADDFFRLVKAGFSERRKKLRSSLSGGLRITKEEADALLAKAGIDQNLRAQELNLEDWHKLYNTHLI